MTDEEIINLIRPLLELTRQREEAESAAVHLRHSSDPREIAERNRAGIELSHLDRRIVEESILALDQIGLWHVAGMADAALDYTVAYGDLTPPSRHLTP